MAQGIQKIQQQLPFPQQGLSQHFQANELHCIFSQGQKLLQKAFCAFGTFRLSQNSKRNLGYNVSKLDDKGNRIPLLQRKEIVKLLQLLPVIKGDPFVTSGWLQCSSSRNSTGSTPQEKRIKVHEGQFKHTMLRFWNAGLSQVLAQLHFQLHQDNWSGLLTTYECLIEHQLWNGGSWHQPKPLCVGTTIQRNQAPNWKQRPQQKGWNKGWFTAGFILCTSHTESTNLRSIYWAPIANVDIHKMPLPLVWGINKYLGERVNCFKIINWGRTALKWSWGTADKKLPLD